MTDHTILAAALEYAAAGIFVFPARVDIHNGRKKVYPCAHWDEASTTDPDRIRAVFRPDTDWTSVCIDTGKSGIVVVDADGEEGAAYWWREAGLRIGKVVETPGGGRHHYYRADPDHPVSIDSSGKVGPHVDVRGQGGFVIAPPSIDARGEYRALADTPWDDLPPVHPLVIERMGTKASTALPTAGGQGDPFASMARQFTREQAAGYCRAKVGELEQAEHGINHHLFEAALLIGHFVPTFLAEDAATEWLLQAQRTAWLARGGADDGDYTAALRTISSGLARGMAEPYGLDEPLDPLAPPAGDEPDPGAERERKIAERAEWIEVDREARIRVTAQDRPGLPPALSLANALTVEFPDLEWAVTGLLPREGIALFSAPQKAGKTTAVGNLVRALADGEKFLDAFTVPEPLKVGVLDTESGERRLYGWLRDQRVQRPDNVRVVSLRGREASLDPRDPRCRAAWLPALDGLDVAVLDVVGPVVAALGLDENDNSQVGAFWTGWRTLLMEAGVPAGLVVHHTGHNETRAIGASAWLRYPDAIWKIEREDEDPTSARYFSAYGRDVDVYRGALEFDSLTRRLAYTSKSKGATIASRHVPALVDLLREHGPANQRRCVEMLMDQVDGLSRDRARKVPEQGVRDRVLKTWREGKSEVYGVLGEHRFMIE